MKVSGSARPELLVAALYLAAHLPSFAPSLEDIDSINFALGLREFDPALHQPHPPGYPVYMALGRLLTPAIASEATILGLLSVVAGAVAIVAAWHLFAEIADHQGPPRTGQRDAARTLVVRVATILLAAAPLFWMSGLRPMSDMPGLALAMTAQALALQGRARPRLLILSGVCAGLAAGIRVQTLLLTVPLLVIAMTTRPTEPRKHGESVRPRISVSPWPVVAFAAACLAWAVPLVMAAGGIDGYLRALGTQAGEDIAFVDMLWLNPSPRRLAFVLYETFVLPWSAAPLAAAVALAAGAGLIVMGARERIALALLLAAFGPYAVAHMLLQETFHIRYALPVLPLVAYVAARGVAAAGRPAPAVAAALVIGALVVALPGGILYGRSPHPAFQAIRDLRVEAASSRPAAVYTHFGLWRPLQADGRDLPVVPPRWRYEWLGPVEYWKGGGSDPIWFLADPKRTDLALVDRRSYNVARYRWAVAGRPELGGARPIGADWYRIAPPAWFAGEGWSLTPETGGLARATGRGPDHGPIEAWIRRRGEPMHLVIGGRHLGLRGDPPAQMELAIDGVIRDTWTIDTGQTNFLRFLDIPEGLAADASSAAHARLTVVARTLGRHERRAETAVRQFDIAPAGDLIYGFGEGWHEAEYDPATGRTWRWTSERSVLRLKGPARGVIVTIRGESPLRYFDAPPRVRVTAGDRLVREFQPADDFEWSIEIPAADMARAGGVVAIETDRVYLPAEAEGSTDERHLALRLFECAVHPVSP